MTEMARESNPTMNNMNVHAAHPMETNTPGSRLVTEKEKGKVIEPQPDKITTPAQLVNPAHLQIGTDAGPKGALHMIEKATTRAIALQERKENSGATDAAETITVMLHAGSYASPKYPAHQGMALAIIPPNHPIHQLTTQ